MSYFYWEQRWVDNSKRDRIKSASLYYVHNNEDDYDGGGSERNYNKIGGFYLTDEGDYRAHVAHSIAIAESEPPIFGGDQDTSRFPEPFPDLLSAQNAILDVGHRYLLTLAEKIRTVTI